MWGVEINKIWAMFSSEILKSNVYFDRAQNTLKCVNNLQWHTYWVVFTIFLIGGIIPLNGNFPENGKIELLPFHRIGLSLGIIVRFSNNIFRGIVVSGTSFRHDLRKKFVWPPMTLLELIPSFLPSGFKTIRQTVL